MLDVSSLTLRSDKVTQGWAAKLRSGNATERGAATPRTAKHLRGVGSEAAEWQRLSKGRCGLVLRLLAKEVAGTAQASMLASVGVRGGRVGVHGGAVGQRSSTHGAAKRGRA